MSFNRTKTFLIREITNDSFGLMIGPGNVEQILTGRDLEELYYLIHEALIFDWSKALENLSDPENEQDLVTTKTCTYHDCCDEPLEKNESGFWFCPNCKEIYDRDGQES